MSLRRTCCIINCNLLILKCDFNQMHLTRPKSINIKVNNETFGRKGLLKTFQAESKQFFKEVLGKFLKLTCSGKIDHRRSELP